MAKQKVYRFFQPLSGQEKNRGLWVLPQPSALTTALSRRSGRSSALPYPPLECRDSTTLACFCHWTVFQCENGRFFVVNF
jgi:hypothetical protein